MILKIAIRNLFRHKGRSVISLGTIVFGCVALIFVGGFFDNVFFQLRDCYIKAHTGHLQIFKKGFSNIGKSDPYRFLIDDPDSLKSLITKEAEVDFVISRLQFPGLISTGENTISIVGQGVEPQHEQYVSLSDQADIRKVYRSKNVGMPVLQAGQDLSQSQLKDIVVGQGLADALGLKIGATATLLVNTVSGSTNAMDRKISGIFLTNSKSFDDMFLRLPLSEAQKLLGTSSVQSLIIRLHKTEDTKLVKKRLERIFQERHLDLEIRTWEELADFYRKTVDLFNAFHTVMRLVTMAVAILGIFNTMNMAVMERVSEIGTILALGTRRRRVWIIFLCEGLVLGFIGGVLGVFSGVVVVSIISAIGIPMPPAPSTTIPWLSHPSIVPNVLVFTFFLAILIGGISSLFPAFKASRMVITEALRYR